MRPLRLALILGLCGCATSSPPAKEPVHVKAPALPTVAELNVLCNPMGSEGQLQGFDFSAELTQGDPTCKECLTMADSIEFLCQKYPKYCLCLQQAFSDRCGKYSGQLREGCKDPEKEPLDVSGPLVQG